jgi:hypothetical protein
VKAHPHFRGWQQVEGLWDLHDGETLEATSGYSYFYRPAGRSSAGSVTAYTILARPQGRFWRGRANLLLDENGAVHWTSENRQATGRDPVWQDGSDWLLPLDNYSVIPLKTRDDEILEKISIDYVQTANADNYQMQRLGAGMPMCAADGRPVEASLITDAALTRDDVSLDPDAYDLCIEKGPHNDWELVSHKACTTAPVGSSCVNVQNTPGSRVPVSLKERAIPKTQAYPTFKLARAGDSIDITLEVVDKSLWTRFKLH